MGVMSVSGERRNQGKVIGFLQDSDEMFTIKETLSSEQDLVAMNVNIANMAMQNDQNVHCQKWLVIT